MPTATEQPPFRAREWFVILCAISVNAPMVFFFFLDSPTFLRLLGLNCFLIGVILCVSYHSALLRSVVFYEFVEASKYRRRLYFGALLMAAFGTASIVLSFFEKDI